ncbi:uncharacterized protein [Bemisia tabaci]
MPPPEGYDKNKAIALANLLLGKRLPYYYCACHEVHWMNYICFGRTHTNPLQYKCPLARPLDEVKVFDKNFFLKDGVGNQIVVSTLQSIKLDENGLPIIEEEQEQNQRKLKKSPTERLAKFLSQKSRTCSRGNGCFGSFRNDEP